MSIYFVPDKGWSLENATNEEINELQKVGMQYAAQLLGLSMMKKYAEYIRENPELSEDDTKELLNNIPAGKMGQA